MKIATEDFNRLASAAASVADDKAPNPIARMVRLEAIDGALTARATDMAYWLSLRAPCDGGLAPVLVSASKLADVVGKLKADTIEVAIDADGLHIKAKGSKRKLAVHPSDAFPMLPPVGGEPMTLDGGRFKECLAFCMPFADPGRTPYDGVNLSGNAFAATDGKTMARIEYGKGLDAQSAIFPVALIKAIDKIAPDGELTVRVDRTKASVAWAEGELSGPMIEGTFPDVSRIVPTDADATVTVPTPLLAGAVASVRALGDGRACIALSIEASGLTVAARSADGEATDNIPCTVAGDDRIVGVNAAYLDRVCKGFGKSDLIIGVRGESDAMKFTSDEHADRLAVVMPMRI